MAARSLFPFLFPLSFPLSSIPPKIHSPPFSLLSSFFFSLSPRSSSCVSPFSTRRSPSSLSLSLSLSLSFSLAFPFVSLLSFQSFNVYISIRTRFASYRLSFAHTLVPLRYNNTWHPSFSSALARLHTHPSRSILPFTVTARSFYPRTTVRQSARRVSIEREKSNGGLSKGGERKRTKRYATWQTDRRE